MIIAGATASLSRDSSAQVHNDPQQDSHQILLKKGSGEVARGNEKVQLTDYERVSFKSEAPTMTKEKEIAPPTLIAPANMIPIFIAEQANRQLACGRQRARMRATPEPQTVDGRQTPALPLAIQRQTCQPHFYFGTQPAQ